MQVWWKWDFPLVPIHPPTNNNANPGFGSFGYFVALLKQFLFPALSLSVSLCASTLGGFGFWVPIVLLFAHWVV